MAENLAALDALLSSVETKQHTSSEVPQEIDDMHNDNESVDSFFKVGEAMADESTTPAISIAPPSTHPQTPSNPSTTTTSPPTTTSQPSDRSIAINPPIPYTFDLGNLLLLDTNPLPPHPTNLHLNSTARSCAQSLITQLLTACPISVPPSSGPTLTLPPSTTALPREKPLPPPKKETTWERFAKKKGIKDKKRGEGKVVYDEAKGEWVPKWGYKGRNKEGEGEWIVEVDEKKGRAEDRGESVRAEGRKDRKEGVKRQERRERANERRGRKVSSAAG